jgi:hypothetical protein
MIGRQLGHPIQLGCRIRRSPERNSIKHPTNTGPSPSTIATPISRLDKIEREQLAKAGARLAELPSAIWP